MVKIPFISRPSKTGPPRSPKGRKTADSAHPSPSDGHNASVRESRDTASKEKPAKKPATKPTQIRIDVQAVVEAIPDIAFYLKENNIVPVGGVRDVQPDTLRAIREALATQGQQYREMILKTGETQTFDLGIQLNGRLCQYEVRLKALSLSEALAFVRDVTSTREKEQSLIVSRDELQSHLKQMNAELVHLTEMLKTETKLRLEEEELLKRHFGKSEKLFNEIIDAIVTIVQRRDPYSAGHQQRVSQLACAIAREMGLASDQVRAIRIAALLHDLGKTFIPSEILNKPGKLSQAEFSVIKTHPEMDYCILRNIDFSSPIADIVRQHHEKMNGTGYPRGLKGEDILIEARIIGVANVIEAMVSNRPYRPALDLDAALKEITDNKGTLYDPSVVDACIRLFREHRFSFEQAPPEPILKNDQPVNRGK